MDFPKLVYDDFYKFIMSAGILLFLIGCVVATYLFIEQSDMGNMPTKFRGIIGIYILIAVIGIGQCTILLRNGVIINHF